ncbi:ImmA/IrrE family metallo-endopeptidase [Pontixanthobacter aestiaquae]|uniref:ImmA/IrrE family metallo-endopeptidase n=1 Tax=Pontixanthobacter aestiaquae TaxID=1509367 RepID=A0A844ZBQ8_9SPHN|nr:ImmA/IrrE family metallo-endopeptidase [Pontixanthobacter aestiaquae]MDN3644651.1 ImmA/IrrE family metallo-endopeptidase [Pontixanthobacter aestiaquae]MXO84340.1 ImmA/IrrE family metallo-endopeptidase [Pontixanthobacter aestiaquae]
MTISRLDLDGIGSPNALAAKIHELVLDMPDVVPLETLCSRFDIEAITEIDTGGFEAALIMDELKASGSIVLARGRRPERRRFSIAHELGHFLIPSHRPHPDHPFECSLSDFHLLDAKDQNRRRRIEAEANRFAAKLLMPPSRVRKAIGLSGTTLESVVSTAKSFGVSKEAMARAWVDAHREPVAVVISRNSEVQRFYRSEDFPWINVRIGQSLPSGSIAEEHNKAPGIYSAIEEIEPDIWFDERNASRVLVLSEQVLGQQNGYAMILLQAELDED